MGIGPRNNISSQMLIPLSGIENRILKILVGRVVPQLKIGAPWPCHSRREWPRQKGFENLFVCYMMFPGPSSIFYDAC